MAHEILNQARKALFIEERPNDTLQILKPLMEKRADLVFSEQRALAELVGLAYEKQQQYDEATEAFSVGGDLYQSGYCQMLGGNLPKAAEIWKNLLPERPNHWCLTLYGMVTGNLNSLPTFLQIRNHLEADIVYLSRAGQTAMAENILRYVDTLSDINYEVYKFAGRALFHAGRLDKAGLFLLRGQKALPNDPEVYYHLGQYYHSLGNNDDAALMLHQCLLISPTYLPAKMLHAEVHSETACNIR